MVRVVHYIIIGLAIAALVAAVVWPLGLLEVVVLLLVWAVLFGSETIAWLHDRFLGSPHS